MPRPSIGKPPRWRRRDPPTRPRGHTHRRTRRRPGRPRGGPRRTPPGATHRLRATTPRGVVATPRPRPMTEPVHVTFEVHGVPQPQGSKTVARSRAGGSYVREDNPATLPWRNAVTAAAAEAMRGR